VSRDVVDELLSFDEAAARTNTNPTRGCRQWSRGTSSINNIALRRSFCETELPKKPLMATSVRCREKTRARIVRARSRPLQSRSISACSCRFHIRVSAPGEVGIGCPLLPAFASEPRPIQRHRAMLGSQANTGRRRLRPVISARVQRSRRYQRKGTGAHRCRFMGVRRAFRLPSAGGN
jgi:hypothetical protein